MKAAHVISVSGGKDSTATRLVALEKGIPHIAVFADTGNEHQITYDYLDYLEDKTGPIVRVKADFSGQFERKRLYVAEKWPDDGVPAERINRALELLHPTGNPFLDLCMLKGRFPSTRARFCSQMLKRELIDDQVVVPLLRGERRVMSWQGVRADESESRASLPQIERLAPEFVIVRPILGWSVERVFAMHRRHGIEPNPLYRMGCGRVGCMPCLHAGKEEIRNIAWRFPEVVERIREWERLVSEVSKRGLSSFFAADKTPGPHQDDINLPMPMIDDVVRWARTVRGGRQYGLVEAIAPRQCSSVYGLCE